MSPEDCRPSDDIFNATDALFPARIMKLLPHTHFYFLLTVLALDGAFFTTTNPGKVAPVTLMIGFLLLALTLYLLLGRALAVCGFYGLSLGRHRQRLAVFCTAGLGGLLALQSMGELNSRDMLVLLPLAVILYVYVSYGRARAST
jgi:hypothetical protein